MNKIQKLQEMPLEIYVTITDHDTITNRAAKFIQAMLISPPEEDLINQQALIMAGVSGLGVSHPQIYTALMVKVNEIFAMVKTEMEKDVKND